MLIQVNFKSAKPVYLQVVDQVKAAAASGALRPGEPLPSIRPLAEQLRINRNTVAKAYTELEGQGVIETIAGRGCFLKENHSPFRNGSEMGCSRLVDNKPAVSKSRNRRTLQLFTDGNETRPVRTRRAFFDSPMEATRRW